MYIVSTCNNNNNNNAQQEIYKRKEPLKITDSRVKYGV